MLVNTCAYLLCPFTDFRGFRSHLPIGLMQCQVNVRPCVTPSSCVRIFSVFAGTPFSSPSQVWASTSVHHAPAVVPVQTTDLDEGKLMRHM